MAIYANTNPKVTINSVDLSDHIVSAQLNYEAAELETTAFGSTTRTRIAGLKDWSLDIEFNQDYAASKVDATLYSLVGAASFAITYKPVNTTTASTNPEFQGNCILPSYKFGNKQGDLASATVSFKGDGTLTRATS